MACRYNPHRSNGEITLQKKVFICRARLSQLDETGIRAKYSWQRSARVLLAGVIIGINNGENYDSLPVFLSGDFVIRRNFAAGGNLTKVSRRLGLSRGHP